MEKMTRTKKYAELRKQIQHDSETEIKSKKLSEYANRLNKINENFDAMEVNENTSYSKAHNRKVLIDTSEFAVTNDDTIGVEKEDTGEVELLKDDYNHSVVDKYIDEVKEYNKDKGILSDTNTQLNIINTIRKKPNKNIIRPFGDIDLDEGVDLSVNAENYHIEEEIEPIEENTFYDEEFMDSLPSNDTNNISKELDDILNEIRKNQIGDKQVEVIAETVAEEETEIVFEETDAVEEADIVVEDLNTTEVKEEATEEVTPFSTIEETVDLMSETNTNTVYGDVTEAYTDELQKTDTTEFVVEDRKSEGLINFIIIILVMLLLIVIGVFIYFVLMDRGII